MKSVKYIPEACKGEKPEFSGEVVVRPPSFDEKYEYLETSGLDLDDSGNVHMPSGMGKIKLMRNLVKLSQKNYVSVSLKNNATGEEYKSFEDLSSDPDCHNIMVEVASQMLNGFKLGK